MKDAIGAWLTENGYAVRDCGTHSDDAVDYPDFAHAVAQLVADGSCRWGIVVDGAGIGSAMAANKVPGVRAANCHDLSSARNSREHNYANVLTLGARLHRAAALALQIVETWLDTDWGAERHGRRVDKITAIERSYTGAPRGKGPMTDTIDRPRRTRRGHHPRGARRARRRHAGRGRRPTPAPAACRAVLPQCATKVRSLVAGGADRIEYHGHGCRRARSTWPATSTTPCSSRTPPPPTSTSSATRPPSTTSPRSASTPPGCAARRNRLRDTDVAVASVIGFPFGATPSDVKAFEARRAMPRRRSRDRHGHQHRRAQERRRTTLVRDDIARVTRRLPRVGRHQQGHHRGGAAHRRGEDHRLAPRQARPRRTWSRRPPATPRAEPPSTTSR